MKKYVILYIRVSTDEQADRGYSLRDQEAKLLKHCRDNGYIVIATFREDYSAKTFNRPEFKKLLAYCRKNKNNVDEVLFVKWDRFSRNAGESYQMLGTFNELGIALTSITQPLDLRVPEQLLMLAVYLAIPEVENQRRSQNVTDGMRRALKEGRYVGSPPKGYSMGRDASNRPVLVPSKKAHLVQEAFEMMAKGIYTQREVLRKLNKKGFGSSKTALSRMLANPIYHGGVHIKAYRDEPASVVDGIHEPIISKKLFEEVQSVLGQKRKKYHVTHSRVNPMFPLKGFLLCPDCGRPLTASVCKGRSDRYAYYHCISPCRGRYRLEDAEKYFADFLESISLKPPVLELFQAIVKERLEKQFESSKLGPKHYEKVALFEGKLDRLQDLFVDGEMDRYGYERAKKRYGDILDEFREAERIRERKKEILEIYKKGLSKLQNFDGQYVNGDIDTKRQLTGLIFPKKFGFEKNKVQTAHINPLLLRISSVNGTLRAKKKRDNPNIYGLSRMVTTTQIFMDCPVW